MSNEAQPDAEPMTLREAAERTSRSITTLRRYIRSGRLSAEKRHGRFGPEYFVAVRDLVAAGLESEFTPPAERSITPRATPPRLQVPRQTFIRDAVPTTLYQELQLKHEQLLVQYGMVRAGGLHALELRADNEAQQQRIRGLERQLEEERRGSAEAESRLEKQLREARLELEGRGLEIAALEEKVRTLEILTRNSVTSETIEQQYREVVERSRRVRGLGAPSEWPVSQRLPVSPAPDEPDH